MEKRKMMVCAAVAAVLVAAAVVYYLFFMRGSGSSIAKLDDQEVSPALMSQLYSIANNGTLSDEIGIGTVTLDLLPVANASALVENGKPAIVYVGSDACPFCAITRWGLVIALMRFGNFTGLRYMTSSASDIYANTATFTFYNSSYYSALLGFEAAELSTNDGKPLQTPNWIENATLGRYNLNNSEVPEDARGSIPFTDFANRSILVGAVVSPQVVSKMDWVEITAALHNSSSPVAQAIIGSADAFTAYICASNASLRSSAACNQGYIANVRLPNQRA